MGKEKMMNGFKIHGSFVGVLLCILGVMCGSSAFAELSCKARWRMHDVPSAAQGQARCEIHISSNLSSGVARVSGLSEVLKDMGRDQCLIFCNQAPEVLQPTLEGLTFQRIAFLEEGLPEMQAALRKLTGYVTRTRAVHQRVKALEDTVKEKQERADAADQRLVTLQRELDELAAAF